MRMKNQKKQAFWLADPQEHDFPAAYDYLELLFSSQEADTFVAGLKAAVTITKKSKDILRASSLQLLPKTNRHVKENLRKIKRKEKLSPILLVRKNGKLIIADGYHRLCSSYYFTEDIAVPCRLV